MLMGDATKVLFKLLTLGCPANSLPPYATSRRTPQDGVGTRKYSNGNLYEGKFSEGEASGEGTMRYVNG